jgi:hypothetical protein
VLAPGTAEPAAGTSAAKAPGGVVSFSVKVAVADVVTPPAQL